MHGHLVAVEVGVERRTHHRVEANRLAFDEHGLERLDRKAVERRSAVQEHCLVLDHLVQDVPHLWSLTLDHLACRADRVADALVLEVADDERLEETQSHLLGKSALRKLELGTDHDHGTAGVVDALAEKVLAETARLALENLGERLERTVAGARDGAAVAAVVEHSVDSLLEHALLVADDDIRRLEGEKVLQTVVAVDDATIEIVQVGRRKATTLQRNERTEFRRNHGKHVKHHPLRLALGAAEALDNLHALGDLLARLLRAGVLHLRLEIDHELVQIKLAKHLANRLGAHLGHERIAVLRFGVSLLLVAEGLSLLERSVVRLGDEPVLVIKHALERGRGHVEEKTDAARAALEEPNVGTRNRKLDVAHALATHRCEGDLDAAAVADHALVLDALVLSAGALPVAGRSKDLLAEETVLLGTVRTVVDRLGILDLTVRPCTDRLRRRKLHLHRVVVDRRGILAAEDVDRIVGIHFFVLLAKD